jgi:hypothetical protein
LLSVIWTITDEPAAIKAWTVVKAIRLNFQRMSTPFSLAARDSSRTSAPCGATANCVTGTA